MKDLSKYKYCIIAPLITEGVKEYNNNGKSEKIYITKKCVEECSPEYNGKPLDIDHIGNVDENFNYNTQIGVWVDCFKNLDGYKLGDKIYQADGDIYNVASIDEDKLKKYNLDFNDIREKISNNDKYIGVSSTFKTPNEKLKTGIEGFINEKINVIDGKEDLIPISGTLTLSCEPRFYGCRSQNIRCNSISNNQLNTKYNQNDNTFTITNFDNIHINIPNSLKITLEKLNKEGYKQKEIEEVINCEGDILQKEPEDIILDVLLNEIKNIQDFYNLINQLDRYDNIMLAIGRVFLFDMDKTSSKIIEYEDLLELIINDLNIKNKEKQDINEILEEIKVAFGYKRKQKIIYCAYLMKKQSKIDKLKDLRLLWQ